MVEAELGVSVADTTVGPRMHRNPDFLAEKRLLLHSTHVAPVQALVRRIRAARGTDDVPFVDPVSGGVRARVLFVLESPAGAAALGSGMLSPDNDDETAANMWRLYRQAGLSRAAGLHWNAVPWYVGTGRKNVGVRTMDIEAGLPWLDELMGQLPDLRLVVTLGKPAEKAYGQYQRRLGARVTEWVAAAHPSPRVKNGHRQLWPGIEAAFDRAAEVSADGLAAPVA